MRAFLKLEISTDVYYYEYDFRCDHLHTTYIILILNSCIYKATGKQCPGNISIRHDRASWVAQW